MIVAVAFVDAMARSERYVKACGNHHSSRVGFHFPFVKEYFGTDSSKSVATDAHGKPRGFGTALFATEADATRAVLLFNE